MGGKNEIGYVWLFCKVRLAEKSIKGQVWAVCGPGAEPCSYRQRCSLPERSSPPGISEQVRKIEERREYVWPCFVVLSHV